LADILGDMRKSHHCNQLGADDVGLEVVLMGWVQRRRDHGGVIFVDLRDREGLTQVVFNPDVNQDVHAKAHGLRSEFVIGVRGRVDRRPEGMVNPNLHTGAIEVLVTELRIFNAAETPPFMIEEDVEVSEAVRLKHRHLDLRRPGLQKNIILRHKAAAAVRQYLNGSGFLDIETPVLTRSTPEGARDYLVPSRVNPGQFYALPQSPQLFKQLLMVSGFERYYQIVRCFRDEDQRADRQPEFTQLDIETSFLNEQEIQSMMEDMMRGLFKTLKGVDLPTPFPRLTHTEAMRRFGSDKPDLRIPLELVDIDDLLKDVEFKIFAQAANDPQSRVAALCVPGGAEISRKEIDDYTKYISNFGARGLAYIKINAEGKEGLQSPILKFLPETAIDAILERTKAKVGDIIFFGADKAAVVNESLGALRLKVGQDRNMVKPGWEILWVVDFPMFEDGEGRLSACHHPFTAPKIDSVEELKKDPEKLMARAYDMVLNGSEIGGGSIRINSSDIQKAVFNILNIDDEEAEDKFGHLLTAMKLGCPPHGGIAFGLDRIVMLMTGAQSIRDVIAFPKTQSATCPLMNAPSTVEPEQLIDLGIRVVKTKEKSQE